MMSSESVREGCCPCIASVYVTEAKAIFHFAWPIVLAFILQGGPTFVAIGFASNLGTAEMNGVSLAFSLFLTTGMVAYGFGSACDTFFSQYYGSTRRRKLGVVLQRSLIIMVLASIPGIAVLINTETLLLAIGEDPVESRICGRYTTLLVPGVLFIFVYVTLSKFAQCQRVVYPNLIITGVALVVCIVMHYMYCLMDVAHMGTDGSALATNITFLVLAVGTAVYIVWFSDLLQETWEGWSLECLEDWGEVAELGVMGVIVMCVDWWCRDITLYLAGLLGSTDLAAQTVIFQAHALTLSVPVGGGIACGVRLGNILGAGDKEGARITSRVTMMLAVLTGVVFCFLLLGLHSYIPRVYSSDPEIVQLASNLFLIIAVESIFTSVALFAERLLRGCGRQRLGATIVFIGHTVSLTIGISLMFLTPWHLYGQWFGFTIGFMFEVGINIAFLATIDWQLEVDRALERTKSKKQQAQSAVDQEHQADSPRRHCQEDDEYELLNRPSDSYDSLTPAPTGPYSVSKWILFKRLCIVSALCCVLGVGIALRCSFSIRPIEASQDSWSNVTTSMTTVVL